MTDPHRGDGPYDLPSDAERRAWLATMRGILGHLGEDTEPDADTLGAAGANMYAAIRRAWALYKPQRGPERPAQLPQHRAPSTEQLDRYDREMDAYRAALAKVRTENAANLRSLVSCAVMLEAGGAPLPAREIVDFIAAEWGVRLPRLPALASVDTAVGWVLEQRRARIGWAA